MASAVYARAMTRRPPAILAVLVAWDGGLEVTWEVDTFFADSEEPERVLVSLNGVLVDNLDGDEVSADIAADLVTGLGSPVAVVSVSFWWSGTPAEEQQSSVPVQVRVPAGAGQAGVLPAMQPTVTLEGVRPRVGGAPATITIRWRTNNHNDGNIVWGPAATPRQFRHNIRPANASVVTGTFTTNQPLVGGALYSFTVEVRNTLHSPGWLATTIVVRAPAEPFAPTSSVRQFLIQTGRPVTSGLFALVGQDRSVRRLILG